MNEFDSEMERADPSADAECPEPSVLEDIILFRCIRNSDPDALRHLYLKHATIIRACVLRVIHNDAEADELVQEVSGVLESRRSVRSRKGKPLSWMLMLARRRAIDRLRRRSAITRAEDRYVEQCRVELEGDRRSDIERSELKNLLVRAIADLPSAQQQIVEPTYYRGMTQRDIETTVGIPLGTVKTRLELAHRKIAKTLSALDS